MKSRSQLNIDIAKYLGFTRSQANKIHGLTQWKYPPGWTEYAYGSPILNVPDFVEMIDRYMAINVLVHGYIPKEILFTK